MTEGKDNLEDSAAPLIEHLTELRQRLIYSVSAFTVAMLACFTVWKPIFNFLTMPLCASMIQRGHQDCGLILIKLQEGFFRCYFYFINGRFNYSVSDYRVSNVAICCSWAIQVRKRCFFTFLVSFTFNVFPWCFFCLFCGYAISF